MTYLVPHSPEKEICISNSGSLSGMTFLCKDMCDIKGFKSSCGNPDFYKYSIEALDYAPFLKTILNEGAILKGITICDEFFYSINDGIVKGKNILSISNFGFSFLIFEFRLRPFN